MKEEIQPLSVYTSEEAGNLLGLTAISIHRYVKKGLLKASVVGRNYRITGQSLLDFLESNTATPNTESSSEN